ncbi:MAG: NADH:ubiquinone reductase (Na(+)-transporting) subunit C [Kiritimatiellales bacterium]|nr:NADH:ubiquinone reductase (Na(+)-transporting) subunit C [Kiritimatiellales bacterium]MCF7863696.1 NADH:ubiquinone reductase (Na(+)-transporting) subunit C [Kiritimatiellales bacterium]
MREDTKTITFAAIVCVTCSLLLSGTAAVLKGLQDANIAFDIQRNIVKAFGVSIEGATRESIQTTFKQKIAELVVDAATGKVIDGMTVDQIPSADLDAKTKLPLYTWTDDGKITKYAFPVSGKGLWSMLYGYLSLDADLETVAGISFYKHGETPGLGAEIEKDWFQSQFKGKHIYKDGKPLAFAVAKGSADKLPEEQKMRTVDGISGATLTGKGVQKLINTDAALYSSYFNSIRGK